MRHVSIAELKANAEELVAAIDAGEELMIMLDGREFKLVAAQEQAEVERRRHALEQITAFRENLRSQGIRVSRSEIKEWINEGRP